MLKEYYKEIGDMEYYTRAVERLSSNFASFPRFQTEDGFLRANLYSDTDSQVLAAVEPLAVPYMLGLTGEEIKPIKELLLAHI